MSDACQACGSLGENNYYCHLWKIIPNVHTDICMRCHVPDTALMCANKGYSTHVDVYWIKQPIRHNCLFCIRLTYPTRLSLYLFRSFTNKPLLFNSNFSTYYFLILFHTSLPISIRQWIVTASAVLPDLLPRWYLYVIVWVCQKKCSDFKIKTHKLMLLWLKLYLMLFIIVFQYLLTLLATYY